jgi:hypothetical protein
MHTHKGVNYMNYKKESNNSIYGAKSTSLAPGSFNTTTYTSAIAHDVSEAPIVVKEINENKWHVWVDSYYNYVLKAQVVSSSSSATVKADATFKITY